jgi:hypothetical protein
MVKLAVKIETICYAIQNSLQAKTSSGVPTLPEQERPAMEDCLKRLNPTMKRRELMEALKYIAGKADKPGYASVERSLRRLLDYWEEL